MTTPLKVKTISPNKWTYCQHCPHKKKRVISKCPECEDYFCISCKLEHSRNQRTRLHATYAVSDKDWVDIEELVTCDTHGEEYGMFCVTCDTLICPVCMISDHEPHTLTEIRQAAKKKINNMYETYVPKIRSKFEYMQKEKRSYEEVSEKALKVMDTRSRVMKAALSDVVDRIKNDQNARDKQNIRIYTDKVKIAYDEMIKKESMLASCSGDSDWNNIVILKRSKQPSIPDVHQITSPERDNVPEIPEINEDEIDAVLLQGLLSIFGKSRLSKASLGRETDETQKELQLELTRLREENQYLKQALKRTSKDENLF